MVSLSDQTAPHHRENTSDIIETLQRENHALRQDLRKLCHYMESTSQKSDEQRYRALIEDQTELVCRFLPQGTLTFVNAAFCHYFGQPYHELIGQSFLAFLPEEHLHILQRHFALCFKNPVAIYEHQLMNAQGEVNWIQWTERAIFDDQDYLIEFQSVGRNITEYKHAQQQLRLAQFALDSSIDAVYWLDAEGCYLYANEAACTMSGYHQYELRTMTIFDMAPHLTQEAWQKRWNDDKQHGSLITESLHRRKDGTIFPVEVTSSYLRLDNHEYLCTFVRDITRRKHMEAELRATNEQLHLRIDELEQHNREVTLLNGMAENLQLCTTVEQVYKTITQYAELIFTNQSGGVYIFDDTQTRLELVSTWGVSPPQERTFAPAMCHALQTNRVSLWLDEHNGNGTAIPPCNHIHQNEATAYLCVPLITQKEKLGLLHLRQEHTTTLLDQWKQVARMVADHLALALGNLLLRERLQVQSTRDPLTGLYNRRYLRETLKHELKKALQHSHSVGVVMLDIDYFKQFNDTYGHDGGDTLLCAMSRLLQQAVRCQDIVCRYGGEEFLIVLPGAPLDTTIRRAQDLCESIGALQVDHQGQPLGSITASLGVASFPEHGATAEVIINIADQALYRAKAQGRNRVIIAPDIAATHQDEPMQL